MNVLLTAALLLSVAVAISGGDSASSKPTPSPTPEPTIKPSKKKAVTSGKDATVTPSAAKNTIAGAAKAGKKTDIQKGKGDEGKIAPPSNPKSQSIKKPQSGPMNDSPASDKTADKKKDGAKAAGKTAKGDEATGKSATVTVAQDTATKGNGVVSRYVTVAQDTATKGNGVVSRYVTDWRMFVSIVTVTAVLLRT